MDIYGGYGTKWSSLLHRLALHVDARRPARAAVVGTAGQAVVLGRRSNRGPS
eukprot:SM000128S26251  [mRNA]  locus=s128:319359:319917:+ [translate_table: standard]